MTRTGWIKALLCTLFLGVSLAAGAQDANTGSISGTITDSSGAAIKGATVAVVNTDRNATIRTLTTNGSGYFTATTLPLGTYTVKVSDQGFSSVNVTGLVLHVNDALTVNQSLKAGGSETVDVTASQARVNLEDPTVSGLINSTQINELVMVSRNYVSLMNLQPGVIFGGATDNLQRGPVGVNGASSVVSYAVNGGRNTSNNWTIDGADNLDRGANLTLYVYPSPESIGEFKTLRGQYSAAFGRNSSGQIDVVTKSGTNRLHGSAYEYFRNDYLDAKGYLANTLGTPINKYRYNDFGFSVGGPVWLPKIYDGRNKTFFFISENWLKEITYSTGQPLVPTTAERNGDFSTEWYKNASGAWVNGPVQVCTAYSYNPTTAASTCTAAGTKINTISPAAQAYLKDIYKLIPAPTAAQEQASAAAGRDPHTITTAIPNSYPNLDTVIRIDQQIGQKFNFLYRYVHDTFPEFIGSGTFIAVPIPGLSGTISNNPGTQHLGKMSYAVNPTTVLNVGYAYSNGSILNQPQGALLSGASPDVQIPTPYPVTVGVIPTLGISGLTTLGGGIVYVDHGINHQAFGDLTKTWHNHTFIGGFSYNHYEKQENSASGGNQGSFSFGSSAGYPVVTATGQTQLVGVSTDQAFANFLLGNANGGFSQTSRNPQVDVMQNTWEGFLQDNWKATPRLTVNIGFRYGYIQQPTDAAGFLNNFLPSQYSASKAPTINNVGLACFTAPCAQTGSNAGQPTTVNTNADYVGPNYINGMIFGSPSASNNNQASPWGNKVGASQRNNIAPRLGFAYDLFGNGKTALRGGYGIAYDAIEVSYWETTDLSNPPAVATYSVTNAVFESPAGGTVASAPSTTPGRIQSVPYDYKTPYIQQFSLGVQQQVTPSLLVEVGYRGSLGTHLAGALQINQPQPGAWRGVVNPLLASSACVIGTTTALINSTCDRVLNQIKPYLGYFAIDSMRTVFNSNYHSLQAKGTKKFSGKTYIDANFTWGKNLTSSPADYSGFIQNIYDIGADYGRATVDRKFALSMDGVFELPWYRGQHGLKERLIGGWEISATYIVNSGLPITVSASGALPVVYTPGVANPATANNPTNIINDNAGLSVLGNTNAGLRPNQVGDPQRANGVALKTSKKYLSPTTPFFNTSAFAATDPNSNIPGTARRGSILGPGFQRADLGIFRNFRIWENAVFQFRGEAFNVANHTNVQSLGTAATSSSFGQVTGYRDARILQIAGKITF